VQKGSETTVQCHLALRLGQVCIIPYFVCVFVALVAFSLLSQIFARHVSITSVSFICFDPNPNVADQLYLTAFFVSCLGALSYRRQ
jgi:hypothetical protein